LALHFFVPAFIAVGHAAFECQADFLVSSRTGLIWPKADLYEDFYQKFTTGSA
jgi:hypothetical protein